MIGSRTRLFLLTVFFAFAFGMLFFALFENYVQAETVESSRLRIVSVIDASDLPIVLDHEIVPSFGVYYEMSSEFDFEQDDSLQKFLHDDHPFNDPAYVPADLFPINSNFTANNSKAFKLRKEAGIQFADMAWHFRHAFSGDKLYIASAYRSSELQGYLIKQGCSLVRCAKIGTSEHQAGLAVDLKVIVKNGRVYPLDITHPNKYYDRLKTNAHRFGFHNTYQKGVEVDGKMSEGRHRRYVGVELATILYENDKTFAEYYFDMMKKNEGGMMKDEGIVAINYHKINYHK